MKVIIAFRLMIFFSGWCNTLFLKATSAVDLDTDKAIQEIMSGSEFSDVTVITIAYVLFLYLITWFVTYRVWPFFFPVID